MEKSNKTASFSKLVISALDEGRLVNLTFSSFPKGETVKIKGKAKNIGEFTVLQLEYFLTEGRVKHENVRRETIEDVIVRVIDEGAKRCDLNAVNGCASLLVSAKGAVNITSKFKKDFEVCREPEANRNNREKKYIFDGTESFMKLLGISDKDGRIHDKKQAKFRQINRFAEQVRDIMKYLPEEGVIRVADLCCGKSYLSFAVYSFLTEILGRKVEMTCVDLKASVIEYCADTARKLGYSGMDFICSDISAYEPKNHIDLVISLHACDIATDIVLDFAMTHKAKVILSTPCCQHEMFNIMDCPELEFISKYSILKQKIAAAATDALRLAKLEAYGYKTDAIELIDPEDTPKNVLLRGILKERFSVKEAREKTDFYNKSYQFMTGKADKIERA